MFKLFLEVYFALRNNKLLHYERYYAVTYDVDLCEYRIWSVDGYRIANILSSCKSRTKLEFTWNILMNRSESLCR